MDQRVLDRGQTSTTTTTISSTSDGTGPRRPYRRPDPRPVWSCENCASPNQGRRWRCVDCGTTRD